MSGHGRREAAWQLNAILWHDRVYADVHGEQGSLRRDAYDSADREGDVVATVARTRIHRCHLPA